MTAVLSWHVKICDLIGSYKAKLKQKRLFEKFESWAPEPIVKWTLGSSIHIWLIRGHSSEYRFWGKRYIILVWDLNPQYFSLGMGSANERRHYNVMSSHWLNPYPEWSLDPYQMLYHVSYCQTSNISCTKSQNINASCLVLQLSLPNPLKPGIKLRIKM